MQAIRILVASVTVILGAFVLLLANGVGIAIRERAQGWNITPLPDHPVAHIAAYASSGIALQFVAAWLLTPPGLEKGTWAFWRRYVATVVICMIAGLVAAFLFFFLVQALLDAGTL